MFMFPQKNLARKDLTHKLLEPHGRIASNVAIDALMLKHLAPGSHFAEKIFIVTCF